MTCTVGMVWDKDKCVGNPIKVKLEQMDSVISQANDQLEGNWRLPNRKELEVQFVKIVKNQNKFENIS